MIDTHVHFWNFDPAKDSWITGEMNAIRRNFTPNELLRIYKELHITGCIAVQANQSESENDFLLSMASQNEIIKGIVGWVDLKSKNLEERLAYWSAFKKIKGWRHVLQAENSDFILSKDFAEGIRALNKYNYTYDLLCYHNQLPDIIKLVDKATEQAYVLDHCGKPDVRSQDLKAWSQNIKMLAQNPNVYCKLSALLVEADWKNWREIEIFNCFDVIFEHFGTDRIMYGSDWPVVLLSRPYNDWFNLVAKYASKFSIQERENLFLNTASSFYQL